MLRSELAPEGSLRGAIQLPECPEETAVTRSCTFSPSEGPCCPQAALQASAGRLKPMTCLHPVILQ